MFNYSLLLFLSFFIIFYYSIVCLSMPYASLEALWGPPNPSQIPPNTSQTLLRFSSPSQNIPLWPFQVRRDPVRPSQAIWGPLKPSNPQLSKGKGQIKKQIDGQTDGQMNGNYSLIPIESNPLYCFLVHKHDADGNSSENDWRGKYCQKTQLPWEIYHQQNGVLPNGKL